MLNKLTRRLEQALLTEAPWASRELGVLWALRLVKSRMGTEWLMTHPALGPVQCRMATEWLMTRP